MMRKNWKQRRTLATAWVPAILQLSSLSTAMACRPREQRQSPWALAPLPPSDEESGPKVLLTWEGEESLEEGEGKAAQRSQRRRRRPRLQSCRAGSHCVQASGSPLGQRTAHPFGAGRQGPCGRQTGSPGGHRDPRAQWRGRQQNRQHSRDHPQPQRSKCPCPEGYTIILPLPLPPQRLASFSSSSCAPPPTTAFLSPALFPCSAAFSASPLHPSPPTHSRSGPSEMRCPRSSCRVSGSASASGRGRATRAATEWAAACRWPCPPAPSALKRCSPRWGRWAAASSCSLASAACPCSSWRWAWPRTPSLPWHPHCIATMGALPPTRLAGSSPPTLAASASPAQP